MNADQGRCQIVYQVHDWLHIPIPLWVQIERVVGTVRLRVQIIPDAPFVRNVTFSFVSIWPIQIFTFEALLNTYRVLFCILVDGRSCRRSFRHSPHEASTQHPQHPAHLGFRPKCHQRRNCRIRGTKEHDPEPRGNSSGQRYRR